MSLDFGFGVGVDLMVMHDAHRNWELMMILGTDFVGDFRTTKAGDFEGPGGPEDKEAIARERRGGDDDV